MWPILLIVLIWCLNLQSTAWSKRIFLLLRCPQLESCTPFCFFPFNYYNTSTECLNIYRLFFMSKLVIIFGTLFITYQYENGRKGVIMKKNHSKTNTIYHMTYLYYISIFLSLFIRNITIKILFSWRFIKIIQIVMEQSMKSNLNRYKLFGF